jgi:acetoin utilization protein AcuB
MLAKELISDGILPMMTSDTGAEALSWMEEYRVLHLPIVNNRELLGLLSEFDLHDLDHMNEPLGNIKLSISSAFVYDYQHILDVLKIFKEQQLSLLPVIDEKNHYLGSITLQTFIKKLGEVIPVEHAGGIIVLSVDRRSLVPSEIARLVEDNDARVLAMFVTANPESTEIDVSVKIDKSDMEAVLQTFNRFGYSIKGTFSHKDNSEDLRERYDSLMNYLNI